MIPKQQEMDGIVKEIYTAMTTMTHLKDTLLVLCGDHGMNDGGNHGGSAPGETSPALVFMSPKLKTISAGHPCPTDPRQDFEYYTMIEQSDIAPTLAGLLGFPVPLNNLGVFIEDFLPLWNNRKLYVPQFDELVLTMQRTAIDQAQLLLRNAMQILDIVKATFPNEMYDESAKELDCENMSSSGAELACLWRDATNKRPVSDAAHLQIEKSLQSLFKVCYYFP
jgi:ethanolaminephosphotransferase